MIGALHGVGVTLSEEQLRPILKDLTQMMKRRHWIAHRADVGKNGRGVEQIVPREVTAWLAVVRAFGAFVVPELRRLS